jgi:hypothetical protein
VSVVVVPVMDCGVLPGGEGVMLGGLDASPRPARRDASLAELRDGALLEIGDGAGHDPLCADLRGVEASGDRRVVVAARRLRRTRTGAAANGAAARKSAAHTAGPRS